MTLLDQNETVITIRVEKLPEGVWLATSDRLDGLIVETRSREEAIDLARNLAEDLLEDYPEIKNPSFRYHFL